MWEAGGWLVIPSAHQLLLNHVLRAKLRIKLNICRSFHYSLSSSPSLSPSTFMSTIGKKRWNWCQFIFDGVVGAWTLMIVRIRGGMSRWSVAAAAAAADDRRGGCVVLMTVSLECQRWDEKSSERDRARFNDN